jgi:hypothetical protein
VFNPAWGSEQAQSRGKRFHNPSLVGTKRPENEEDIAFMSVSLLLLCSSLGLPLRIFVEGGGGGGGVICNCPMSLNNCVSNRVMLQFFFFGGGGGGGFVNCNVAKVIQLKYEIYDLMHISRQALDLTVKLLIGFYFYEDSP